MPIYAFPSSTIFAFYYPIASKNCMFNFYAFLNLNLCFILSLGLYTKLFPLRTKFKSFPILIRNMHMCLRTVLVDLVYEKGFWKLNMFYFNYYLEGPKSLLNNNALKSHQ